MKEYAFSFSGTKEEFDAAVKEYQLSLVNANDSSYLFEIKNGNYCFGIARGGHSGGYWYCPSYNYRDNTLLISGKIEYRDPSSNETGIKKWFSRILYALLFIILLPLIIVSKVYRLIRKIIGKPYHDTTIESLQSLMINHFNCKTVQ